MSRRPVSMRRPVLATAVLLVCFVAPLPAQSFALRFDGVDDWVDVAEFRHVLHEFTVEAWVRKNRPTDDQYDTIVSTDEFRFQIDLGDHFAFGTRVGGAWLPGPSIPVDGSWQHVAVVWRGGAVEFLRNGESVFRQEPPGEFELDVERLRIGHDGLSGLGGPDAFTGWIDEVRVWDHARSPEELQRFLFARFASGAQGLVGYWTFGEGNGALAADSSGFSQDGVLGLSSEPDARDPAWVQVTGRSPPVASRSCGYAPMLVEFVVPEVLGASDATWSFDDGGQGSGLDVVHEFVAAGVYEVTARVVIPDGSVVDLAAARISVHRSAPVAEIRSDVTSGDLPLAVSFTDASSGTVARRAWEFGEDAEQVTPTQSTEAAPLVVYRAPGRHQATLRVAGPCDESESDESVATVSITIGEFRRGDTEDDGQLTISDGVRILEFLFLPSDAGRIDCFDAADADDDGSVALTDAVVVLQYLFLGGAPPRPPFPAAAHDPTRDGLDCLRTRERP